MRLFHLVEKNDRVGTASDRFGELTALVVADVSRRRPDQTGDRELFHILGHIDPDQVLFVVEQRLGEGFGEFGLADAGRTEEQKRSERTVRILDARPRAQDRVRDLGDRFVLSDHAAVQNVVEVEQFFALALHQSLYRDAGPAGDDPRDLLLGDGAAEQGSPLVAGFGAFGFRQFLLQFGQFPVFQFGGAVQVVFRLGGFDLGVGRFDLFADLLHFADRVLLVLPLDLHRVHLVALLGELRPQFFKPLLR